MLFVSCSCFVFLRFVCSICFYLGFICHVLFYVNFMFIVMVCVFSLVCSMLGLDF